MAVDGAQRGRVRRMTISAVRAACLITMLSVCLQLASAQTTYTYASALAYIAEDTDGSAIVLPGNLYVQYENETDLSALSALVGVEHDFFIEYNHELTSIALPNLVYVGGTLSVWDNPQLTALSLPNLASMSAMYLGYSTQLKSAVPLLVTHVPNFIYVYYVGLETLGVYSNIATIGGSFTVADCYWLENAALPLLTSVGTTTDYEAGFQFTASHALATLELASIGTVGYIYIYDNDALATTNLSGVSTVTGYVYIVSNPALRSVADLRNVASIGQSVTVFDNAALCCNRTALTGCFTGLVPAIETVFIECPETACLQPKNDPQTYNCMGYCTATHANGTCSGIGGGDGGDGDGDSDGDGDGDSDDDSDSCSELECVNGTCFKSGNLLRCVCEPGYEGERCNVAQNASEGSIGAAALAAIAASIVGASALVCAGAVLFAKRRSSQDHPPDRTKRGYTSRSRSSSATRTQLERRDSITVEDDIVPDVVQMAHMGTPSTPFKGRTQSSRGLSSPTRQRSTSTASLDIEVPVGYSADALARTSSTPEFYGKIAEHIVSHIRIAHRIGGGAFGDVYLGVSAENDDKGTHQYALKAFKGGRARTELLAELQHLATMRDPHIVRFHGVLRTVADELIYVTPDNGLGDLATGDGVRVQYYIVMDYMNRGSLESLLRRHQKAVDRMDALEAGLIAAEHGGGDSDTMDMEQFNAYVREKDELESHMFTTRQLIAMCVHAASGMAYLAKRRVVHCDLASRNLLVDDSTGQLVCRVADFGLASQHDLDDDEVYMRIDSKPMAVRWSAKEVLSERKYSAASDVFAFGMALLEVFSGGRPPYDGCSNATARQRIMADVLPEQPICGCPDVIYELMQDCWKADVSARPSMADVLYRLLAIQNDTPEGFKRLTNSKLGAAAGVGARAQTSAPRMAVYELAADAATDVVYENPAAAGDSSQGGSGVYEFGGGDHGSGGRHSVYESTGSSNIYERH